MQLEMSSMLEQVLASLLVVILGGIATAYIRKLQANTKNILLQNALGVAATCVEAAVASVNQTSADAMRKRYGGIVPAEARTLKRQAVAMSVNTIPDNILKTLGRHNGNDTMLVENMVEEAVRAAKNAH